MITAVLQGEFGKVGGPGSAMARYTLVKAAAVTAQAGQCRHTNLAEGGILGVEAGAGHAQFIDAVLIKRATVGQTRSAVADRTGATVGAAVTQGLAEGAMSAAEDIATPLDVGRTGQDR